MNVDIPTRYNASLLVDAVLDRGDGGELAIVSRDQTVTYSELWRRICQTGHALRTLGAARGDRVLLVLDDSPAFPAAFLGAIRAGIIPVPVNPFYRPEEYTHFVRDSGARLVVTDRARAGMLAGCVEQHDARPRIVSIDPGTDFAWLDEVAAGEPAELSPFDTAGDDVAFWLYSSGSTGRPKGVVHRQRDLLYTAETYAREVLQIARQDVTFSTTKLFHAYGLGNNLSFPYSVGATTVLMPGRPTADGIFDMLHGCAPTLFFSTPTLFNAMLNSSAAPTSLESVRLCISAAEPLPAEVWQRWHDRYGLVILDGVGSTEMLHIYCSNREDDCLPGSSGRPIPGYDIRLLDDRGNEMTRPGTGDMYVRGGSTLAEYWRQPEETADSLRDGWFYTRDRYRRDADGYYWYEGRTDDMFKVNGLWVSPAEVEARLIEHPSVVESAVVGSPVDGFMKAKAFVVLRQGTAATDALAAELVAFCHEKLPRFKVPAGFAWVGELPKTITGKIQRFKLREQR